MNTVIILSVCILLTCGFAVSERIDTVGFPITPTRASDNANNTLLFFPEVPVNAAVFAFRFWFIHQNDIIVQFFRPNGEGYRLYHEISITPSVDNALEDVYMRHRLEKCQAVEVGDRIGVFQSLAPGSIPYRFDPAAGTNKLDASYLVGISLNDTVELIVDLPYPHSFAMAVYFDTEYTTASDLDDKGCTSLNIPEIIVTLPEVETTTALPITGAPGATGPTGPQGLQGVAGAQGSPGNKGEIGQKGDQGIQGVDGASGQNGNKGDKGDLGALGGQGDTGENGEMGFTGEQGPTGNAGLRGDDGSDGAVGPSGPTGLPGAIGPNGEKGTDGSPGLKGERGEQGGVGSQGIQGVIGPTGPAGRDGRDVTFDRNGTAIMEGPAGPKGERGAQGAVGPAGANGRDGNPGERGTNGLQGQKGDRGDDGAPGTPGGPVGPKGEPGPPGPPGQTGAKGENSGEFGNPAAVASEDEGFFDSSTVSIIMFIWLIIITIVMIIQCLCCGYWWTRHKKQQRTKERMAEGSLAFYDSLGDPGTMQREKAAKTKPDKLKLYDAPKPYDGIQPTTPRSPTYDGIQPTTPRSPGADLDYDTMTKNLTLTKSKREMMSTMREDQFQEFNNDTITREDAAKRQSLYKRSQSATSGRHISSSGTVPRQQSTTSEPGFIGSNEPVFAVDSNGAMVTRVSVSENNEMLNY